MIALYILIWIFIGVCSIGLVIKFDLICKKIQNTSVGIPPIILSNYKETTLKDILSSFPIYLFVLGGGWSFLIGITLFVILGIELLFYEMKTKNNTFKKFLNKLDKIKLG